MVVDGLGDSFAFLESFDLLVHEVEVLGFGGKGGDLGFLATITIKRVVVIKADDGGHVTDQGVTVWVSTFRGLGDTAEDSGNTAHEGGLAASAMSTGKMSEK